MKKSFLWVALLPVASAFGQAGLQESGDFPNQMPGPVAQHPGGGCFLLARGSIVPGDIDWVQVRIPWASSQTVVDVDFPNGTPGSALFASMGSAVSGFNIADNNAARDRICGLSNLTVPVGSPRDSAVDLGGTPAQAVINIAVTGAEDTSLTGGHSQTFTYDVWVFIQAAICTSDAHCNDNIDCTIDSCIFATGECLNTADHSACDNGLYCDGPESCSTTQGCRPGTSPPCSDGVGCTFDRCDEATDSCTHEPDDFECDNGWVCDGQEWCDPNDGCQEGAPPDCDDGVDCTDDYCDEDLGECVNMPEAERCDNGVFCDGMETCDAVTGCQTGVPPNCDDGLDCTTDACDEVGGACSHDPVDDSCDDGVFCNGEERCDGANGCVAGENPCPDGHCRERDKKCVECVNDADCDDGSYCNGREKCTGAGVCKAGKPPCDADETCNELSASCGFQEAMSLDIKPNSCPNNVVSQERMLNVALVSVGAFDVRLVNMKTVRLARVDGVGRKAPPMLDERLARQSVRDVTSPFTGKTCDCADMEPDGVPDLVLRFATADVVEKLRLDRVASQEPVELVLTGKLRDGTPFEVYDCVVVGPVFGRR